MSILGVLNQSGEQLDLSNTSGAFWLRLGDGLVAFPSTMDSGEQQVLLAAAPNQEQLGQANLNSHRQRWRDGTVVWGFDGEFCVELPVGQDRTLWFTENDHHGTGNPVLNRDSYGTVTHAEWFTMLAEVDLIGTINDGNNTRPLRRGWEGSLSKDPYSRTWAIHDNLSQVTSSWGITTSASATCYAGVGVAGLSSVETLTTVLATSGEFTISLAPSDQKIYVAYPASLAPATVTQQGIAVDMLPASTIVVSGSSYYLLESRYLLDSTLSVHATVSSVSATDSCSVSAILVQGLRNGDIGVTLRYGGPSDPLSRFRVRVKFSGAGKV